MTTKKDDATMRNSNKVEKEKLFSLNVSKWYCRPMSFTVNSKIADIDDFGVQDDRDSGNAEPWSCADMHFTPIPASSKVLEKYSITADEYAEICEALEDKLSFGHCGLCV